MIPEELRYTSEHEWVQLLAEGRVRVGITDHAQNQLGDIVFVQLPDIGTSVDAGDAMGEVESTKSVSELYAPLAGEVVAVNADLADAPELANTSPYDEGWMLELRLPEGAGLDDLLDADAYGKLVEG